MMLEVLAHPGLCYLWAGGHEMFKKGRWMFTGEQTSKQHSSMVLLWFLPWVPALDFFNNWPWRSKPNKPFSCQLILATVFVTVVENNSTYSLIHEFIFISYWESPQNSIHYPKSQRKLHFPLWSSSTKASNKLPDNYSGSLKNFIWYLLSHNLNFLVLLY